MARWLVCSLGFALLAAGCGEKHPRVFPVKGQVFWQGKPAAGAMVNFHPADKAVDNQNPTKGPLPSGLVDEDGNFELATYGIKGAPAGRYQVTVIWAKNTGGGDEATYLLPERYMHPATSGLPIVEVHDQPTELEPFNLTN